MTEREVELHRMACEALANAEHNGYPPDTDDSPEDIALAMIEGGVFSDGVAPEGLVSEDGAPLPEYVEAVRAAIETRRDA